MLDHARDASAIISSLSVLFRRPHYYQRAVRCLSCPSSGRFDIHALGRDCHAADGARSRSFVSHLARADTNNPFRYPSDGAARLLIHSFHVDLDSSEKELDFLLLSTHQICKHSQSPLHKRLLVWVFVTNEGFCLSLKCCRCRHVPCKSREGPAPKAMWRIQMPEQY